jgi:hypothetical protein
MPIYSFRDLARDSAAAESTKPFHGTPVLFDPDDEESNFVLYVETISPKQLADMSDEASRGGRKKNTAKFNRLLVGKVVKGWTGLTPEAVRALFGLSDAGVEAVRKQLEADGVSEIAWSRAQAEQFMDDSIPFNARVNELASDMEVFEAAQVAYERKASRPGFTTGVAA